MADSLLTVLAKLYVSLRQDDVERRAAGELTNAQYSVLHLVAEEGHPRVSELAHAAGVTLPTMSITVSRLARRGLVCRRPSSARDSRNSSVALTAFGAWAFRRATQARYDSLQTRVRRLSQQDQQALSHAVAILRRMLDGLAPNAVTGLADADGV